MDFITGEKCRRCWQHCGQRRGKKGSEHGDRLFSRLSPQMRFDDKFPVSAECRSNRQSPWSNVRTSTTTITAVRPFTDRHRTWLSTTVRFFIHLVLHVQVAFDMSTVWINHYQAVKIIKTRYSFDLQHIKYT